MAKKLANDSVSRIACLLFSQLAHVDIRRVRLHGVRLPLGRLVQHGRALPLDRADADRHACHHGALRASTSSLQNVACRVPNAMMVWEERRSMRPTPSSQQCFVSQLACLLCSRELRCEPTSPQSFGSAGTGPAGSRNSVLLATGCGATKHYSARTAGRRR
jgi:hypothetical protein